MANKFKIYPEQRLMVDVCNGALTYEDLKKLVIMETESQGFLSVNRILSNILDADLQIGLKELEEFVLFMAAPEAATAPRWAILTRTPDHVALSQLLKSNPKFSQMIEVFSTLDACIRFLGVNFKSEQFEEEGYTVVS